MNTFNIVTGPVRSGKSTFVKRHAKDSDIIIDEYSGLCMSFDKDMSYIYWLVLDPIRTNEDYYTSLCDQLSKYGQVNHIKIGSIEKFMWYNSDEVMTELELIHLKWFIVVIIAWIIGAIQGYNTGSQRGRWWYHDIWLLL